MNLKTTFKTLKELEVQSEREITVTGKRQITIPKAFYDRLGVQETLIAYLTDDGIFLKPKHSEQGSSIYDEDTKLIIQEVLADDTIGTSEKAEEIVFRLGKYNDLIQRRIREFNDDLMDGWVDDKDVDVSEFGVFLQQET